VLSASELAAARADAGSTFSSSAVRHAHTSAGDGQGGNSDTYPATGQPFACRLEANARRVGEDVQAGAVRASSRWRLLLAPADAAGFVPADRVLVDATTTFHVDAVFGVESENVVAMLDLTLVEGS
jgi:hypothetical protein